MGVGGEPVVLLFAVRMLSGKEIMDRGKKTTRMEI